MRIARVWCLFGCFLSLHASQALFAQSSIQVTTPTTASGLATAALASALSPTLFSNCPTGTATTWKYQVVAYDVANGADPSPVASITNGCMNLLSNINYIVTPLVNGSQSCSVFRIQGSSSGAGSSTGLIQSGMICGAVLSDTGITATSATIPGANTSGALTTTGAISAPIFNANSGSNAGGVIFNTGAALPSCPSASPCVANTNQFYQQAPSSSISSSWGITWPNAAPSTSSNAYSGPLVLAPPVTTANDSFVSIGTLTNPNSSNFVTGNSNFTSANANNVVTIDSNGNAQSSGLPLTNVATGQKLTSNYPVTTSANSVLSESFVPGQNVSFTCSFGWYSGDTTTKLSLGVSASTTPINVYAGVIIYNVLSPTGSVIPYNMGYIGSNGGSTQGNPANNITGKYIATIAGTVENNASSGGTLSIIASATVVSEIVIVRGSSCLFY